MKATTRFLNEKIKQSFYQLENGNHEEQQLFKHLNEALDHIEHNAFCGIQIPKKQIPKEYQQKEIKNLWKYNLPQAWRLLYSLADNEIILVNIIIEWMPHKTYERKFKY